MIRGTTPTLLFNLPFSASIIKSAEITIKYKKGTEKILIIKNLEDCNLGETSISTILTQEETLQFPAKAIAYVQLRILTTDDRALATDIYTVTVKKLLSGDVIQ